MTERRVVTKDNKIYNIVESSGKYTVYRVKVGFPFDHKENIGKTSSLDDAISIIKANSGSEIKSIS